MNKSQQKDLYATFLEDLGVTVATMTTSLTLAGPLDILQIQYDTLTAASATTFRINADGRVCKVGAFASGAQTREVTFVGRVLKVHQYLHLTRHLNDSHEIFVTLVTKP